MKNQINLLTIISIFFGLVLFTGCNKDDDPQPEGPIVESLFANNAEGWKIIGDAQGGYVAASYSPDGGVSDGYIYANDDVLGGVWFFSAPQAYLGDKTEYYGATLDYSLFQDSNMSDQFEYNDIVFKNNDDQITFRYDPGNFPGGTWTDYSVAIKAGNGWLKGEYDSGVVATEADIKAVLSNVTEFLIRGEFESGPDNGGLDNVIIDK